MSILTTTPLLSFSPSPHPFELTGADLFEASLPAANLANAILTCANLDSTDLAAANLANATLVEATGADLRGAAPVTEPTAASGVVSPPEDTAISGGGSVAIVAVNKGDEYVDLRNGGAAAVDLSGWRLLSEKGSQDCALGGVIGPGETLRVWAMASDAGQGGYNCDFKKNIWNNSDPDAAVLFNAAGAVAARME